MYGEIPLLRCVIPALATVDGVAVTDATVNGMNRHARFIVDECDDPQIRNLWFLRIDARSLNGLFADIGYETRYQPKG